MESMARDAKTGTAALQICIGRRGTMETIITAAISSGATLIVCLVNNFFQQNKVREENNKTIALIDYRLTELTDRVNKHNNVIERTYKLEELTALQEEKIKVANHRIEDLEREGA